MVIRDRAVREGAKDPTRHETPPIVVITHLGHLWGHADDAEWSNDWSIKMALRVLR